MRCLATTVAAVMGFLVATFPVLADPQSDTQRGPAPNSMQPPATVVPPSPPCAADRLSDPRLRDLRGNGPNPFSDACGQHRPVQPERAEVPPTRTGQSVKKAPPGKDTTSKPRMFAEAGWPPGTVFNDVYTAYSKAYTGSLPLMIFFAADWCSYCRAMKQEVFGTPEFTAAANRSVFLALNVEKDDKYGNVKQLMTRLGITEFPAFAVVDVASQNMDVCGRIVGYHNPPQFINVLSQVHWSFARIGDPANPSGPPTGPSTCR